MASANAKNSIIDWIVYDFFGAVSRSLITGASAVKEMTANIMKIILRGKIKRNKLKNVIPKIYATL